MKIVIPLDLCTEAEVLKEARQVERDHRDIVTEGALEKIVGDKHYEGGPEKTQ